MDDTANAGGMSRRQFLGRGAVLALSLGLLRIAPVDASAATSTSAAAAEAAAPAYSSWQDLYRTSWKWDRVVYSSHGRANCMSACSWSVFVKDGLVWREEQNAVYDAGRGERSRLQSARLPEGRLLFAPDVRAVALDAPDPARGRARLGQVEARFLGRGTRRRRRRDDRRRGRERHGHDRLRQRHHEPGLRSRSHRQRFSSSSCSRRRTSNRGRASATCRTARRRPGACTTARERRTTGSSPTSSSCGSAIRPTRGFPTSTSCTRRAIAVRSSS